MSGHRSPRYRYALRDWVFIVPVTALMFTVFWLCW